MIIGKQAINNMARNYGNDGRTALESKTEAQKIAFAPIMFQAARALRELGVLQFLQKNRKTGSTIQDVSIALNLSEYSAIVLLEAGLGLEMMYVKNDLFFLTKTGFYIQNDPVTVANLNFTQDVNYLGMNDLKKSLQTGKPEGLKVFGEWDTIYEGLSQLPKDVQKSWFDFDHIYSDHAFPEVLPMVFKHNPKKLLDVGGNTGKWAIQCVNYNEEVQVTILDHPGQWEVAAENIKEKAADASRVHGQPMNLLDHSHPFPNGFDVVWMSQFLDCFGKDDIVELLKRGRAALNEGGRLFILETYWDQQRFAASSYSLMATSLYFTCLANGNSRMYFSEEMEKMVVDAGLKLVNQTHHIGLGHTLYECQKVE